VCVFVQQIQSQRTMLRLASHVTRRLGNAHFLAFFLLVTSLRETDAQTGMLCSQM